MAREVGSGRGALRPRIRVQRGRVGGVERVFGVAGRGRGGVRRGRRSRRPRGGVSPVAKFLRAERAIRDGDETSRLLARRVHPGSPRSVRSLSRGTRSRRARARWRIVDAPETIRAEGTRRVVQTFETRARRAVRGGVHPRRGGGGVVHLRRGGVHRRLRSHRHLRRLLLLRRRVPLPRGGDASYFNCAPALDRLESIRRLGDSTSTRTPGRRRRSSTTRCAR